MNKRHLLHAFFAAFIAAFSFSNSAVAQSENTKGPWKCKFNSKEDGIRLVIDLYEESVDVPGMDMFGPMNGYLGGNIYGVWMLTSFDVKDDKHVSLRLSNDLGSETQECLLTQVNDTLYNLQLKGGVSVKKVVNKKLVKIPASIELKRTDR